MRDATPIFQGQVSGGKMTLDLPDSFTRWYRQFEGQRIDLTCGKHRERRSNPQNSLYWVAYVTPLAKHYGWEPEEMHDHLKRTFNPKSHILSGEEVIVGGSTAKMDRSEFTSYLERIEAYFAQEGFTFPKEGEVVA